MRAVYEGGAAWQRAERHYEAFSGGLAAAGEGSGSSGSGAQGVSCLPAVIEARLERLVRRFRAHFISAVRPQALPSFWSVDYPVFQKGMRLRGKQEPALAAQFAAKATDETV